MNALLASEVLKLSTTRAPALLLVGFVAVVLLALSGPSVLVGSRHTSHPLIEGVGTLAIVFALLLGINISAGDHQHGTLRAGLLIQPGRTPLFAAKQAHHIPPMWAGALTLTAYTLALTLAAWRAFQRRELTSTTSTPYPRSSASPSTKTASPGGNALLKTPMAIGCA